MFSAAIWEDDTHFVEAVNLGLAAAARRGCVEHEVEHEEVGEKLKEILLP